MTTGSDLDRPLGQNRGSGPARRGGRGSWRSWLLGGAFVVLFAGAGFLALQDDPLRGPTDATDALQPGTERTIGAEQQSVVTGTVNRVPNDSGASISQTLTDSGQVVTKITPQARNTPGPLIISGANRIGQDLQLAHLPIPELLEDSEHGQLPVIAADGRRAFDAYARPWSGARGTRIAIVVGGLGLSQTGTQQAIRSLPPEVTLAFAASGNSLQRWLQEARRGGHEVLLQVPFEPFDYPNNDPGPHTLLVADDPQQNLADIRWAMGRITNYTGIMNYMGGRYLSDPAKTEALMRELAGRGVLFLDDGTSARTVSGAVARAVGVPYAEGDLVIDEQLSRVEIMKRLDDVERIADRHGSAIAVASAFDVSVAAIADWANEAKARGIEIVAVSALAEDPERL